MPVREFIDSNGVRWRVWSTRPSRGEMLSGEFEHGWLTFESATRLKRRTPIPAGWEAASTEELEELCRGAAETRRTPSSGLRAVDEDESTEVGRDDRGLDGR